MARFGVGRNGPRSHVQSRSCTVIGHPLSCSQSLLTTKPLTNFLILMSAGFRLGSHIFPPWSTEFFWADHIITAGGTSQSWHILNSCLKDQQNMSAQWTSSLCQSLCVASTRGSSLPWGFCRFSINSSKQLSSYTAWTSVLLLRNGSTGSEVPSGFEKFQPRIEDLVSSSSKLHLSSFQSGSIQGWFGLHVCCHD